MTYEISICTNISGFLLAVLSVPSLTTINFIWRFRLRTVSNVMHIKFMLIGNASTERSLYRVLEHSR
jgi:hypothetical protein